MTSILRFSCALNGAVVLLTCVAAGPCVAQVPATKSDSSNHCAAGPQAEARYFAECAASVNRVLVVAREPTLRSAIRSPSHELTLSGNSDSKAKTVTAQVSFLSSGWSGSSVAWNLSLEAPLDSAAGETDIADLKGIHNSATAGLDFVWYRWTPHNDEAAKTDYCNRVIRPDKESDSKVHESGPEDVSWCFGGSSHIPEKYYHNLSTFIVDAGHPLTFAMSARIGQQQMKFSDAGSNAEDSTTVTPWSVGAAAGILFPRSGWLLVGSYDRVHKLKAGKATQLCLPFGTGGTLQCRSTSLGPPKAKDGDVIGLETRRWFSSGLGASLKLQHDLSDGTSSVQVPLYVLQSMTSALNGGIVAGWSTSHKTLSLTAFVGAFASPTVSAPKP